MGFKEDLMLKKMEAIVKQEFDKGDYDEEDLESVLQETRKAVNSGKIRRFEDLKNFVHAKFDQISKKELGP